MALKINELRAMKKKDAGDFDAHGSVREANPQRPHAVRLQLHDILGKAKT